MYSFLVSILIGIGVVLPGVSGSAIAILVGIYDTVLTVLNDSSIKSLKKIIMLFPIIIGIMVGVIIFGNILLKIYEYHEFQMKYIFIGLIFGGVPILVNELKDKGGVLKMKPLIFSVIFSLFFSSKIICPFNIDNSLFTCFSSSSCFSSSFSVVFTLAIICCF